jgi:hypothetical protein
MEGRQRRSSNSASLGHRLYQPDRDGAKSRLTLSIFSGSITGNALNRPLRAAKARGRVLGNPCLGEASAKGRAVTAPAVKRFAEDLMPIFGRLRRSARAATLQLPQN